MNTTAKNTSKTSFSATEWLKANAQVAYKVNYKNFDFFIYRDGGGLDMMAVDGFDFTDLNSDYNKASQELFNKVYDQYELVGLAAALFRLEIKVTEVACAFCKTMVARERLFGVTTDAEYEVCRECAHPHHETRDAACRYCAEGK